MAYTVDPNQMRKAYTDQLALQQQNALRGAQDIYSQRGMTGSGQEAYGLGQLGQQFGAAAGMAEADLQKYLGTLDVQSRDLDLRNKMLEESKREFEVKAAGGEYVVDPNDVTMSGKKIWKPTASQSNYDKTFEQNKSNYLTELYLKGYLKKNPFMGDPTNNYPGPANPLVGLQPGSTVAQQGPEEQTAKKYGFGSSYEMSLMDPSELSNLMSLVDNMPPGMSLAEAKRRAKFTSVWESGTTTPPPFSSQTI